MQIFRNSEKGQILVLLVLVLIGLLGFTALAVDGGMIYADRRFMQSAADASSLAGAGAVGDGVEALTMNRQDWSCADLTAKINSGYIASENKASANDFTIAMDTFLGTDGHNHGVFINCNETGKYVDVFVMLTRETNTSFVHLFTNEAMRNTVTSITRVEPQTAASDGNSIISLSKRCGNNIGGVHMGGTTNVNIEGGGGIWSNSCTDAHGTFDVLVDGGAINYYCPGDWCPFAPDGGGSILPAPSPVDYYHPLTYTPIPDFGSSCWSDSYDNYRLNPNREETIGPGNYRDWDIRGILHLEPGLYCISGSVVMNAGSTVDGTDVTFYFTGSSLTLNGGLDATLAAPNGYTSQNPPPDRGQEDILIYVKPGVNAIVKINGTSGTEVGGTIYAPDSLITINGNATEDSPSNFFTSIIGYDVNLTGASNINFIYDESRDFNFPARLQVQK